MKAIATLLSAALLGLLAGCNTMEGVGQDVQAGGKAVERAADKHNPTEPRARASSRHEGAATGSRECAAPSEAACHRAFPAARAPRRWGPRDIALVVLATLATIIAARYAADFLVPIVAGVLLAYALEPLVARMAMAHIPRGIGATRAARDDCGGLRATAWWLRHDAAAVVAELPDAARKLRAAVQDERGIAPIKHVREAAAELEKAAAEAGGKPRAAAAKPAPRRHHQSPTCRASSLATARRWWYVAGQLLIAATLALFLLAGGDVFRRKLVSLVGPSLGRRRVTVEILNEIDVQVQRYLLVTLVTNIAIAIACWGAFAWLGLERAALWATLTGVLHFIPYVGGAIALVLIAAAALIETGSFATARPATAGHVRDLAALGLVFNTWLAGSCVPDESRGRVRRRCCCSAGCGAAGDC